jgi:hypothetical protein
MTDLGRGNSAFFYLLMIALRFFFFGILAPDFLAVFNAAALACAGGWPAFIISAIFSPITFLDLPLINGIA